MVQLIPYVPFTSGSPFTPEAANAIAKPIFDGQTQYLGHLDKIADADLDDSPSSIKARVRDNELNLKVSAGSGLNALYTAGKALYDNNVINIGAGTVTLQPLAANYVYVDTDGIVKSTTEQPPIVRALLAIVTTNTTGVTTILDEREGYKVEVIKPFSKSLRNFGGRGDQGVFLAAGGEVLSDGEYYFTSFEVPAGTTITVDRLAKIYCTGRFRVAGNIIVTPAVAGGAGFNFIGTRFVQGATGSGFGGGTANDPGQPYNYNISPAGSGGGAGNFVIGVNNTNKGYTTGAGGAGGGGIIVEAAGAISVTGTIRADGGKGDDGRNDDGNSDTSTTSGACSGSGGGSGGLIQLKSLSSIVVSGLLSVAGGVGGNSAPAASYYRARAGAGGGGGYIVLQCPNINTTGSTLNIAGGASGVETVNPSAPYVVTGGCGGSYAGRGGDYLPDNSQVPSNAGKTLIQYFTPAG